MRPYEYFEGKYRNTKPIRGRSADIRPIGMRRRDWERLEMDGDVVACVLYHTQVVRYYPDGRVGIMCSNWHTPSTAQFISEWSPFLCRKTYNRLWVYAGGLAYPVPNNGEITFEVVDGRFVPTNPVVMHQRVVDRDAMKQVREPYKEFLRWGETFLKMSDGWLMHETRVQVSTADLCTIGELLEEEDFPPLLFHLLDFQDNPIEIRRNGQHYWRDSDLRFAPEQLKARLYRCIRQWHGDDVLTLKEVKPGPKPLKDVVLKP